MAAPKHEIELLPRENWERTSFGKFIKWLLTVGRYIVIFTELIVIIAFVSRFKLDRDLSNLYDEIKRKQALVEASQDLENKFRFLQTKINLINKIEKEQPVNYYLIQEIASLTPIDVSLADLSISQDEFTLNAVALSEEGFNTFLVNLKGSGLFEQLSLGKVQSGSQKELGIRFELTGKYLSSQSPIS